jgi:hypothetical protein
MPTARIPQYAVLIISRPKTLFNHFYASQHKNRSPRDLSKTENPNEGRLHDAERKILAVRGEQEPVLELRDWSYRAASE